MRKFLLGAALLSGGLLAACVDDQTTPTSYLENALHESGHLRNGEAIKDPTGDFATTSTQGDIDLNNEFFQNLGINGRRCVTCHLPTAAWGTTPSQIQAIFDATDGGVNTKGDTFGLGAIFRTNDGSVSPDADVSTLDARRHAYSMLLTKGLIRVSMPIPATGDFDLVTVDDPYGHSNPADVSEFRRPLPATNLKFLSAVMWDGRETFAGQSIHFDLSDQANGATQGHAQSPTPLTTAQRESIVNFESALATAATKDDAAGDLTQAGANGGPDAVQAQTFYIGINDLFGDSMTGAPFNPVVFNIYDAWNGSRDKDRAAVARGQALFNNRIIQITGVGGINDNPAFGRPAVVQGTCSTCHDSPNGGSHSVSVPLNIGLVDASRRTADLPLYTLQCNANGISRGHCAAGDQKTVTDIGRGMISGNWIDIGKFKGPVLRGLAGRAPYFHNGSAASLGDAVDFYNDRFSMHLSGQEKSDLVAFLQTL